MVMTQFTPIASLVGGALIGLASVLLMAFTGRIAGVSGIAVRLFPPYSDGGFAGRIAFIIGLAFAPVLVMLATGHAPAQTISAGGTLLICRRPARRFWLGLGQWLHVRPWSLRTFPTVHAFSRRDAVFMATAGVTVFVTRHLL